MSLSPEELRVLSREGCVPEELIAALAPLTEPQRRKLSPEARRLADWSVARLYDRSAIALASLGCATGVRQAAQGVQFLDSNIVPLAVQVLADRKPSWLPELPVQMLARHVSFDWRLVRALVRAELIATPEFVEYGAAMAHGLPTWNWRVPPQERGVLFALDADPGLLDHDLWVMLGTEGVGRLLAMWDAFQDRPPYVRRGESSAPTPERSWHHALTELVSRGVINRGRFLDQVLSAFLRDWSAIDLPWFVDMHAALEPTIVEVASRQNIYFRLLAVEPGKPVALAQKQLGRLLNSGDLDAPAFLAASRPPMLRTEKNAVMTHLKLLTALTRRHAELADEVAAVARLALEHQRFDVRERAASLIGVLTPDGDGARGHPMRAGQLLSSTHSYELSGAAPIGAGRREPDDLVAVADANELAELLGRLVEEAAEPIQVERAIDGLVRFATSRPAHSCDVLRRRAAGLIETSGFRPWSGLEVRVDLAALTLVWLVGAEPGQGFVGRWYVTAPFGRDGAYQPDWTPMALVSLRTYEVAEMIRAGGGQLLSMPTTSDGALSATVLSARLANISRTARPWPLDAGLAAMRVAPEHFGDVEVMRAHRTGDLVGRQLGRLRTYEPRWERVVGTATNYLNMPDGDVVSWRDSVATAGAMDNMVTSLLDRRDPLRALASESRDGEYAPRFEQVIAQWPLLMPHHPELLAAHAHIRLSRGLVKNRAGSTPLLAALAQTATPTGPVTCSALALGLAAKNAPERTASIDALVELAARGALDGSELGRQIADLLRLRIVVGQRVCKSLADAARADTHTADSVLDALALLMEALPGRRDAQPFVELAAEYAATAQRSIDLPIEFEELARSRSTSLLASACRRLANAREMRAI